jgi:hypothetical protein
LLPSHRIIYTDQRPHVAIFEDAHCSLALGQAVYALWSAVRPAEKVTDAAFGDWTAKFIVVADVAANRGIRGFAVQDMPGCLVIQYRDQRFVRHYIDDPSWLLAVGLAGKEQITQATLLELAPEV